DLGLTYANRIEQSINDGKASRSAHCPSVATARNGLDTQFFCRLVGKHRKARAGINDKPQRPFAVYHNVDERAVIDQIEGNRTDLFSTCTMNFGCAEKAIEINQPLNTGTAFGIGLGRNLQKTLISVGRLVVILQS